MPTLLNERQVAAYVAMADSSTKVNGKRIYKAAVDHFQRLLIAVRKKFHNNLWELLQGTAQNFGHVFKNK